ncbi:signal peptidase I [Candidatus Saccharibacteria bacterium]|nr:signal peptidase I [Candidatus Saccharibacteria bacterium]
MQPNDNDRIIVPVEKSSSHTVLRDLIGVAIFILSVVLGAFLLNTFVFQTYSVQGPSMQDTLHTGDRLLVNKFAVSSAKMSGKQYMPERGQVVVFSNPLFHVQQSEEYLVKRVMALPGEHVVLKKGVLTVYNKENPDGFQPDKLYTGPKSPSSGTADLRVPAGEVFVAGDNRVGEYSFDSRNGLGTVPIEFIQGPVAARIFPITQFKTF